MYACCLVDWVQEMRWRHLPVCRWTILMSSMSLGLYCHFERKYKMYSVCCRLECSKILISLNLMDCLDWLFRRWLVESLLYSLLIATNLLILGFFAGANVTTPCLPCEAGYFQTEQASTFCRGLLFCILCRCFLTSSEKYACIVFCLLLSSLIPLFS